jgi:hypothetical protein
MRLVVMRSGGGDAAQKLRPAMKIGTGRVCSNR